MSDETSVKKMEAIAAIKEGIEIGVKNIGPVLVNTVLYLLTCWIPYINIGTTIGLSVGIVGKASRGEPIGMTEIFDSKYRKYMGEYFLATGLVGIGVLAGLLLLIIPGIVISFAWTLVPLLVVDKGKNPMEAVSLSNSLTYGYKRHIFGAFVLTGLVFGVVMGILLGIGAAVGGFLMGFTAFLSVLLCIFEMFVVIGIRASIYRRLAGDV
jgi:hypothetical protein